ncbi:Na+/H+ antiporter subunit E [Limisphaera sp. VF-2]|jgi:multisubunit Na+/H+ antiporter MnhE subunit|uniref:Na+/H+ antiporter subunit E n=1 Tax=Limisphaera sp. VF-2 TaxID=3400418 RepID=UPI00256B8178|nr:Na+/H+ antiporter subunit E [Limisphaera sp.]
MKGLALHLILATLWLFLSPGRSLGDFYVGLLLGFCVIALFHSVLGVQAYPRKVVALARFLWGFLCEFVKANLNVAVRVLFRSASSLRPDFVNYDVAGLTPGEILVMSYCITLTPGTTTVQISEDMRTLVIHALDVENPDELRQNLDRNLKTPLLQFTR